MFQSREITTKRVMEILKSVDKTYTFSEPKNILKDTYKGNNEPIYLIEGNSIIIFDSILKELNNDSLDNIPDYFLKNYIHCYIHIVDFNGFPQLWDVYGVDKYIAQGIEIMAFEQGKIGDYYFRNFDSDIKDTLNKIWSDKRKYDIEIKKDKGYISSVPLNVIKPKRDLSSLINLLKKQTNTWFKKYDKHDELYNKIVELAYGFSND